MMLVMVVIMVSLSKHAKQPLSLLLLPKVFVHLSFTSYPDSLVNVASPALLFVPTNIFFFLNPFISQLYSHLPGPLFCDGVEIRQWSVS